MSGFGKSIILLFFLFDTVVFYPHSLLGGPMRTRCACAVVLEGRQFISVPASRRIFANSAKTLQLLGDRAWVSGSTNPQSKLQQLLPTSAASEKHKKSHTYMIMLELLGPRAAETVKRISHGFPATQYGHKRESAQLWLAETKGRGQTVGHQSHIHKR